jgi:hypothetical protein
MNPLEQFKWANNYLQYLKLKEKGLKKEAKISLQHFIKDFHLQDKSVKRQFIDIVNRLAYSTNNYNRYLPYNLSESIFKKEIEEWIQDEPENPIPYKWSYNFELVKQSLELDPFDQETLFLFGQRLVNKIGMNQHEISSGFSYQGNPAIDLTLIKFYKPFLKNIKDEQKRVNLTKELTDLENCANVWIRRYK